jgi:hypothetical protein
LDHIPAEYRGMVSITTPSAAQNMAVLTEAGMNMYLFRSDKTAALPWQKHLAEVVLPSIRKTGSYSRSGMPSAPSETVQVIQAVMQGVENTLTQALNGMQASLDKTLSAITGAVLRSQVERYKSADKATTPFPRPSEREFDSLLTPIIRELRAKKAAQKGGPLTCLPNEEQKLATEWMKSISNMFFGALDAPKAFRGECYEQATLSVYEFLERMLGRSIISPARMAQAAKAKYRIIDWIRDNGLLTDLRKAQLDYFNKYRKPEWQSASLIGVDPEGPPLFPNQQVPF